MGPSKYDVVVDYGSGGRETISSVTMSSVIAVLRGFFVGEAGRNDNIKITIYPIGHKDRKVYAAGEEE